MLAVVTLLWSFPLVLRLWHVFFCTLYAVSASRVIPGTFGVCSAALVSCSFSVLLLFRVLHFDLLGIWVDWYDNPFLHFLRLVSGGSRDTCVFACFFTLLLRARWENIMGCFILMFLLMLSLLSGRSTVPLGGGVVLLVFVVDRRHLVGVTRSVISLALAVVGEVGTLWLVRASGACCFLLL